MHETLKNRTYLGKKIGKGKHCGHKILDKFEDMICS